MDINNVNSNINTLNNSTDYQLNKTNDSSKIENKSSFLNLTINEYNQKRDELSESLQTFNEGLGVSSIAQKGLEKQIDYLKNIETKLENVENKENIEDKNIIKNDLNKELLNFREEAFSTQYNKEKLLLQDEYEEDFSISISTKEAYFSIDKPNTPEIATRIGQEISRSDLNDNQSLQSTKDQISLGIKELEGIKESFNELSNNLESSARESISEQINLSKQNLKNKEINFGQEMNDFSKTNVTANMGYLAASQANIMQEQSVRLLSK
eukprot:gnl/Chilomastix_cuspidata/9171.p1 GENE.gnl/Chilomastix_cuspidata/9171~~gnl/Chilomastix_cuspidata/9171.p1  ORF type:complete len:268 (+),score=13.55 gnl/Chilomastix_cuspidata/9171:48-851(+)